MASTKKLVTLVFLTMLLTITSFLPVCAQTQTPWDALIQAIAERAQRDVELGKEMETAAGLDALFGEQAKQVGMPLSDVVRIYEDAYRTAEIAKPWWEGWLPNVGWIAAIALALLLILRDVLIENTKN